MMDIYRTFVQEMFHYKGGSMRYEQREGAKLWREKHHSNLLTEVMTNFKFIALVLSSAAVINSCSSNLIFPAGRKEASKIMVTSLFTDESLLLNTLGELFLVQIFFCFLGDMV